MFMYKGTGFLQIFGYTPFPSLVQNGLHHMMLRTLRKHVDQNRELFLEAWNEHIGN